MWECLGLRDKICRDSPRLQPMGRSSKLRAAVLLAGGALAVHKIRFALGYPNDPDSALAVQGHQYLSALTPLIVGALAIALGGFLGRVCQASRRVTNPQPRLSLGGLWVASSGCLVVLYTAQELCEGFLSNSHPSGLAGVFGHGGWIAVFAAMAIGALIAVALGDESVCICCRGMAGGGLGARLFELAPLTPKRVPSLRDNLLAYNLASRAPPAASS
jgi:hypothetical protein